MTQELGVRDRIGRREFERECEKLRPLGEAYVARKFSGQLGHADAQDVVAEVLWQLDVKFEEGRRYPNLRAAFFKSVNRKAIDFVRSNATRPTVSYEEALDGAADPEVSPEELAERNQERSLVHEALLRLRPKYREALYLRFGVGLTGDAIAAHKGISLPAVKRMMLRATRQVREQFMAIVGGEHCDEMRELARRQLLDKYLADVGTKQEVAIVQKHLNHCGSCSSFVTRFHDHVHELASGALVSTAVSEQLTDKAGVADHVSGWIANAGDASHVAVEKARLASFKVANAMQGGEAAGGSALAGTGQKIAAVCATGATAATCVASGVVPGVSVGTEPASEKEPAPVVKTEVEPLPSETTLPATPADPVAPTSEESQATAAPPTPKQQVAEATGIEESNDSTGSSPATSTSEFGGPSGGGGSSGGGSGGGSSGFGIE